MCMLLSNGDFNIREQWEDHIQGASRVSIVFYILGLKTDFGLGENLLRLGESQDYCLTFGYIKNPAHEGRGVSVS